ncbi:lipoprotein [Streptomyces sp. OZ13]|uniref:lipoprotein n=1 Tax=Streptomyces sp. OZ13 TaxID=3452210 RepID=UPI003F8AD32A
MRGRLRGAALGVVTAVLVTGVASGCSSKADSDDQAGGPASRQDVRQDASKEETQKEKTEEESKEQDKAADGPAEAGSVGAPGSACPMPVTFSLAADWKPERLESDKDSEFAAVLDQGPVTLVCEIDAKPAGHIGFIRVWVGAEAGDDTRKALQAFVADGAKERTDEVYKETKAGKLAATEVTYINKNEFFDDPKKERAFAVATPRGLVVVDLGGFDSQEHEQMLPAYELAKRTLRIS